MRRERSLSLRANISLFDGTTVLVMMCVCEVGSVRQKCNDSVVEYAGSEMFKNNMWRCKEG